MMSDAGTGSSLADSVGEVFYSDPKKRKEEKAMSRDASIQVIIQNLEDAGCDSETVEEFLALEEQGKTEEQLKLLARQRQRLLDQVHKEERCIYCLDYLTRQLNPKWKTAL